MSFMSLITADRIHSRRRWERRRIALSIALALLLTSGAPSAWATIPASPAETEALGHLFAFDGPVSCAQAVIASKNLDYARWELASGAPPSCYANRGNGFGIAVREDPAAQWERLTEESAGYGLCSALGIPAPVGEELRACIAHRFHLDSRTAGVAFARRIPARAEIPRHETAFCPAVEIREGRALCIAEYRLGAEWWRIAGTVTEGLTGGVVKVEGRRHWRRQWTVEHEGRGCSGWHVKALVETNEDGCAAPMASDIEGYERLGVPFSRVGWHGTDTAGFSSIVVYRCHRHSGGYECRNAIGDAFRFYPR